MAPRENSTSAMLADYLVDGFWRDMGASPFKLVKGSGDAITFNLSGISDEAARLARMALQAWETVVDIDFREVRSGGQIRFDDAGSGGPETSWVPRGDGTVSSATVTIPDDWVDGYGFKAGGYGFQVYMHEIGHALGLGHSGYYPTGASFSQAEFDNDSWQQTVMSYLDQDENPTVKADKAYLLTPMQADILAIQEIYGRQTGGPTAGNTVWGVGSNLDTYLARAFSGREGSLADDAMTIYDAGGRDVINFSNDGRAQQVSLVAGRFLSVYGQTDNVAIAHGVTIENYVAGRASDRVWGNGVGNTLTLGMGSDTAYGGAGKDKVLGGDGSDRIFGDSGNDILAGHNGADQVRGGTGDDSLSGGFGTDTLLGGDGADILDGGHAADRLSGGKGADTFVIRSSGDRITDFTNDRDTLRLDDSLWGGGGGIAKALSHAGATSQGDILFDFGGGKTLLIQDMTNIAALSNDLVVI